MNNTDLNSTPPDNAENGQHNQENGPVGQQYLAGLTVKQAHDYVVQHLATLQRTKSQLENVNNEITLWQSRVKLAQDKSKPDLADQAENRVRELQQKSNTLQLELWDLENTIPALKQELARMVAFSPSVDASQLLAQFEQVLGKDAIAEQKINEQLNAKNLDDELAHLKEKLKQKSDQDGNIQP
ncbi:hypothetical protein JXQ70_20740 [bacterium]|nr:hypothetical protein [bacterium]